jgi:hypothetical protein
MAMRRAGRSMEMRQVEKQGTEEFDCYSREKD